MGSGERFQKELLDCLRISRHAEEEIERLPVCINCSLQIHPLFFDFDVGFIDPPGVRCELHIRTAPPFKFGDIVLNPAVNSGVIDMQTPFEHHLFQVAIAERIPQVPADAEENDLGLEMAPFERVLLGHV